MVEAGRGKLVVGVVSDTHGPLDRRVIRALERVDHVIHAGDLVSDQVLPSLQKIGRTTAVRGNMDRYDEMGALPRTATLEVGGVLMYVLHDLYSLDLDPAAAGIDVVVHGHTHQPEVDWRGPILFLNPGSVARPRGGSPPTLALLEIEDGRVTPTIVTLD